MLRNHIGFAVFMSLLLIAPKFPLHISGGSEKTSVSLGIAGLVIWYLNCPWKLFSFPKIKISHPLCWLIIFAIYAFVVSLLSANTISIAYSVQYLLYVVIGTILMRRYCPSFVGLNCCRPHAIFFTIAAVYGMGIIVSILTGPIYPYLVRQTQRHWGGHWIQQGVGFAESQNIAGPVVAFFVAACIYLYHAEIWKKWILLTLLLLALLGTLSRGAIVSLMLAIVFVYCLDNFVPFIKRGNLKVSALKDIGFAVLVLFCILVTIGLISYAVDQTFITAILSGFGLDGQHGVATKDTASRFNLWIWGINKWTSQSLLKMIFGGGFRSSMEVIATGMWKDAHNVYITILGDFGIVGLMLFAVSLFVGFFRYARLVLIGKARDVEKFGLVTLLSLGIDNMTGPYFYSPACLSLLIFTLAITFSRCEQNYNRCGKKNAIHSNRELQR